MQPVQFPLKLGSTVLHKGDCFSTAVSHIKSLESAHTSPFAPPHPRTTMQGMVVWRARLRSASLPDAVRTFVEGVMAALTYPIGDNLFVWTLLAPVSRLEEVGLAPRTRVKGPQYTSSSHQPGGEKEATDKCSNHLAESQHQAEEMSVKEVASFIVGSHVLANMQVSLPGTDVEG